MIAKLWRDSQPFGWMGIAILYYTAIFYFFSGWLLWILFFCNPLTLRVSWNLWKARKELLLAGDVFAAQLHQYLRQRKK